MSELHGYGRPAQVNEKDWKLFRSRLPGWQEAYMEQLMKEYADILEDSAPASHKFWALEERIRRDKQNPGVVIKDMRRSRMRDNLVGLLLCEVITEEDLDGFSEELKSELLLSLKIWRE